MTRREPDHVCNKRKTNVKGKEPKYVRFWFDSFGGADNHEDLTMKCIVAIAIAAAFFAFPAAAQNATKGKSSTAPGKTESTPGHEQTQPGGAKNLAPGQNQAEPGGAKGLAPGADQRKKK